MPKIEHALLKKQGIADKTTVPAFVKTIGAPEEEAPVQPAGPPMDFDKIFNDPVLQLEAKKKETLEKILLLRKTVKKDVTIDGLKFTLKLLNSNDSADVISLMEKLPEAEQNKGPLLLLAASLVSVDDVPIETVYDGPSDITDVIFQRYSEIIRWPSVLVNSISKEYRKFVDDEEKKYDASFLAK